MAGQVQRSNLAALLGPDVNSILAEHADAPVSYGGGGSLPAGIDNGVAQLTEIKIGVYEDGDNAGKPYFTYTGVVIAPDVFTDKEGNTYQLAGEQARQRAKNLFDTNNKSKAENVAWMQNELKKLGADPANLRTTQGLEKAIAVIKQTAPYFKFRTWIGEATEQYPTPSVNLQLRGLFEGDVSKLDAPQQTLTVNPAAGKKTTTGGTKAKTAAPTAGPDFMALATKADGGDDTAGAELAQYAVEHGIDYNAAADWAGVAEQLIAAMAGSAAPATTPSPSGLGVLADGGDAQAEAELTAMCAEAGIDPNEYGTWDEIETALLELGSGETEPEAEATELSYAEMGAAIDNGEDDGFFEGQLTEAATAAEIDPNAYGTWAEVGAVLDESAPAGGEPEADYGTPSYTQMGALIDNGQDDGTYEAQLTALCGDNGMDPNDYAMWADVGAALDELSPAAEATDDASPSAAMLGAMVDNGEDGDGAAEAELYRLSEEHVVDPNEYGTWAEFGEYIDSLSGGEGGEDFQPQVEESYMYKPPRARKEVETVVTAAFAGTRTCNLRNVATGEVYRSVSWDVLQG